MMDNTYIEILSLGNFTSIQDMPTYTKISQGVPIGGPCDLIAATIGKTLFDANVTCLECTGVGPKIRFKLNIQFAITGANMDATLNGEFVPMYQIINARKDDIIHLKTAKNGFRSYIILNGSTEESKKHLSSKHEKGTKLKIKPNNNCLPNIIPLRLRPSYSTKAIELRYMLGPESFQIPDEVYDQFESRSFTVSRDISRMGIKLQNKITQEMAISIISSAILPGTIQLTHDGTVIIMLQDAQTTGGYPRLGNIITADLPALAQAGPHTKITFSSVDLDVAQRALSLYQENLSFFLK